MLKPETSGVKELHFEDSLYEYLSSSPGFIAGGAEGYDHEYGLHLDDLGEFLQQSQPETWKKLQRNAGPRALEHLASEIYKLRPKRGNIALWREPLVYQGASVQLAYHKPSSGVNPDHEAKYAANRLRVIRQFKYKPGTEESIDLVILLNGMPLLTMELKNEFTGQNVQHAITQYRKDRDAKNYFLRSCLVHFAVDNTAVYMCARLANGKSVFLPFNKDTRNPTVDGKFASHYLWEEVLHRDSILNLIQNYYQEVLDKKTKELKPIFPRYHQLDVVRKLLSHAREHGAGQHYLVQHSAGSGKSNSIAWLAHQLASLHNEKDELIFDSVIVITDRRILDRQLQVNIKSFERTVGVVREIDKDSRQLLDALMNGERIIISTLQKFGFLEDLQKIKGKRFAVIVDEAHSSQTGENVKDLKMALTDQETLEEIIKVDDANFKDKDELTQTLELVMKSRQKMPHLSFFAFTATPKPKTLELFGIPDGDGKNHRAFHTYTMRQAIEEGFILDVLENYATYETYFELVTNDKADGGKEYEKQKAKRLLLQQVGKHPHAIRSKVYIMLDHFITKCRPRISGQARAMIVTGSRAHAVLYKLAVDEVIREQSYPVKALVAFSGTVEIEGVEYTEEGMNAPIKDIPDSLAKEPYRLLIVANKYQTGFDEPLLHTMYVDKKLGGVATVQTLSRLNRKRDLKEDTMVLDFVNSMESIQADFQAYYQQTTLEEGTDSQKLYNLKYQIEQAGVFTQQDIDRFAELFIVQKVKSDKLSSMIQRIVDERYLPLEEEEKERFRANVNKYVRQYTFLSQLITFVDAELEKFYLFVKLLFKYLPYEPETLPLEVVNAVDMDKFRIEETGNGSILLNPEDSSLENPSGDGHKGKAPEIQDMLAAIVEELNQTFAVDLDETHRIVKDIKDKLFQDESLRASFQTNNIDELKRMKVEEAISDALIANADDYLGFMTRLDNNPAMKKQLTDMMFHVMKRGLLDQEAPSVSEP